MNNTNKKIFITTLYVTLLIASNLLATKMINFFGLTLPSAVLVYPFCFMCGDIITEVWGYEYAKKTIWIGFIMNLIVVATTTLAVYLPYPEFFTGQEAFSTIFMSTPRVLIASFIGYLGSELVNAKSLEMIKKVTGEKLLFVRTIGSSIIGQVFDTVPFILIAFYGTMPFVSLIGMMMNQYLFKVICEAIGGTPLAYAMISWAKED
jgi:uncharacterized integral membrane protein (TIGR00697 family)